MNKTSKAILILLAVIFFSSVGFAFGLEIYKKNCKPKKGVKSSLLYNSDSLRINEDSKFIFLEMKRRDSLKGLDFEFVFKPKTQASYAN
ncbi:MAG: hypothetical protein ACI88L_000544 [Candidatus Paceibacteria bacterium]|jgi:hypothetical protein